MNDPIISLPENPTRAQVLHAAMSADNHADKLRAEQERWRGIAKKLFARADNMRDHVPQPRY